MTTAPPAALGTGRYPTECECDVLIADGTVAHIRPIRPDDAVALASFHEHLSGETVYRRFFGAHPHLGQGEIERFTEIDYRDRLALVAEVDGVLAGVARYDCLPGRDRAEVAFVVADHLQGRGLGTLLLEHLAVAARRRGVAVFEAQTLATNHPMQEVFRQVGFDCGQRWSAGVVEVTFPITPTQNYLEKVIGRDALAVRAWLGNRVGTANGSGLGLICRTRSTAEAVAVACQDRGIGLSLVVIADDLGIDLAAGLSYLATSTEVEVVAVEWDDLVLPRRMVALAREASRRRPVVALMPAGSRAGWCEQAGVESLDRIDDLADRVGQLLLEVHKDRWQRPARGGLAEVSGCDPSVARAVLDQAGPRGGRHDGGLRRLEEHHVLGLLAAYGISSDPLSPCDCPADWSLILEDRPGDALTARVDSAPDRGFRGIARFLPLTDRDVEDLARLVGPAGRDAVVKTVPRAAHMIDDQPEISRIRIPLSGAAMPGHPQVEIWTGPPRDTNDDPFVRRLPARRPSSDAGQKAERPVSRPACSGYDHLR